MLDVHKITLNVKIMAKMTLKWWLELIRAILAVVAGAIGGNMM